MNPRGVLARGRVIRGDLELYKKSLTVKTIVRDGVISKVLHNSLYREG